jgi:alpha-amylase
VEFLAETYYHSLSSIGSLPEFCEQVKKHMSAVKELFGQTPTVFRNTELIFKNEIAQIVREMGFAGIIAEGADHLLRGRSANQPYRPPEFELSGAQKKTIAANRPHAQASDAIKILLKNYRLSDDVAFRFSNRDWSAYPLRAETYADWLSWNADHSVNLFMDYETFGEHQWADTGIFDFLRHLPEEFYAKGLRTATPSEVLKEWGNRDTDVYDAHAVTSWADMERDLSAWQGNHIQECALSAIYAMEEAVKATGDERLIEDWRKLLTSDHLYYMCTKYWSDGDVHKYFSPYDSPYEAYRRFSHALCDLKSRLSA